MEPDSGEFRGAVVRAFVSSEQSCDTSHCHYMSMVFVHHRLQERLCGLKRGTLLHC